MGKYKFSDKQDKRREERRPKPIKKIVKINQRSAKGRREDKLYSELRSKFLTEHPVCEARLDDCTGKTTEVHHKKARGIWLLIAKYFLPVCNNCHRWIETHPKEAKEKGFSLSRLKK